MNRHDAMQMAMFVGIVLVMTMAAASILHGISQ